MISEEQQMRFRSGGKSVRALVTLAPALLLGVSLSFSQAGGSSDTGHGSKSDSGQTDNGKKGHKGDKKGHKGGKKGKKGSDDGTVPPPK